MLPCWKAAGPAWLAEALDAQELSNILKDLGRSLVCPFSGGKL